MLIDIDYIVKPNYNININITMKASWIMSKEELVQKVIQLQRKADRARRQYELDIWMSLPLTIAQLKSLFFISDQGRTTSGKLAVALGVTPTNITGIIDRLVRQGLVSRSEDAQDRRLVSLRATDKGEELVTKLRSRRTGYLSAVLDRMQVDDLARMVQGLAAFVEVAEAQEAETQTENTLAGEEAGLRRGRGPLSE
jgi:DNA-binding MarR family transcriptional regulator